MTRPGAAVRVTGVGLVTSYGNGTDRFWRGLLSGRPALGPGHRFTPPAGHSVGEVPQPPGGDGSRRAYAEAALAEALAGAGYRSVPENCLVVVVGQTPALVGPGREPAAGMAGPSLAWPGVTLAGGGPFFLTHACASAAFGVSFARELMAGGVAEVAVVVGATTLNQAEYASLSAVRALSEGRARPFDLHRDGITVGEGAGALVLETARRATGRDVPADIEVTAAACRVAGAKAAASDQEVLTGCLDDALGEAGRERVDYVQAHATGTPQGDAAELAALETLADRLAVAALPVSSHKGATGHLLHSSCFPAVAAAMLALRTGVLPPTPGLREPERTERLRLLREPTAVPDPRQALVVSAGFGGNNAALLLSRR